MSVAGESESLDSVEPLDRHIARHGYDRLIMLSDGIFAIAATLLALELQPPERWDGTFASLLQQSWRAAFGYMFGFFVVGAFWVTHRNIFARIRHVDAAVTTLTLMLLCLVAMVPGAAALLAEHGPSRAMKAYFALAAAIGTVQIVLWFYAAYVRCHTHPELSARQRDLLTVQLVLPPLIAGIALMAVISGAQDYALAPLVVVGLIVGLIRRRLARAA